MAQTSSAIIAAVKPMVLIFSMPKTAKVADLRLSPAVSLALDSADGGQDIVLAEGRAELIAGADRHPARCKTGTWSPR